MGQENWLNTKSRIFRLLLLRYCLQNIYINYKKFNINKMSFYIIISILIALNLFFIWLIYALLKTKKTDRKEIEKLKSESEAYPHYRKNVIDDLS